MKKLIPISIAILLLSLTSCATERYYADALNSWKGAPQESVYRVWGYPNQVETLPNGHKLLVFQDRIAGQNPVYVTPASTSVSPNSTGGLNIVSTSSAVSGGGSYDYECLTFFELNNNGNVLNTSFRGNNCVASRDFMINHTYTEQTK